MEDITVNITEEKIREGLDNAVKDIISLNETFDKLMQKAKELEALIAKTKITDWESFAHSLLGMPKGENDTKDKL